LSAYYKHLVEFFTINRGQVSGFESGPITAWDSFGIASRAMFDHLALADADFDYLVALAGPHPRAPKEKETPVTPSVIARRGRFNKNASFYEEVAVRFRSAHLSLASKILKNAMELVCTILSNRIVDNCEGLTKPEEKRAKGVLVNLLTACLCGTDTTASNSATAGEEQRPDDEDDDADAISVKGKFATRAPQYWPAFLQLFESGLNSGLVIFFVVF
jgi:hypothetical protein